MREHRPGIKTEGQGLENGFPHRPPSVEKEAPVIPSKDEIHCHLHFTGRDTETLESGWNLVMQQKEF